MVDLQEIMKLESQKSVPVYGKMASVEVDRLKDLQNIMALSQKTWVKFLMFILVHRRHLMKQLRNLK